MDTDTANLTDLAKGLVSSLKQARTALKLEDGIESAPPEANPFGPFDVGLLYTTTKKQIHEILKVLDTQEAHYQDKDKERSAITLLTVLKSNFAASKVALEANQSLDSSILKLEEAISKAKKTPKSTAAANMTKDSVIPRLKIICAKIGLVVGELGPSQISITNTTSSFFIEVTFSEEAGSKDTLQSIKVYHGEFPEETDERLFSLIRQGDFYEIEKDLVHLKKLYSPGRDFDEETAVFKALHALETDLLEISRREEAQMQLFDALLKGHGIARSRNGALSFSLFIFAHPFDLYRARQASEVGDEWRAELLKRSLRVSVDIEAVHDASSNLPTEPQLLPSAPEDSKGAFPVPLNFKVIDASTSMCAVPVCASLVLDHAIPMSAGFAQRVIAAGTGKPLAAVDGAGSPSVQSILFANYRRTETQTLENTCAEMRLQGTTYRFYSTASGEDSRGLWVQRIPCAHASLVFPVLQHIRQQVVFNHLFGGLFSGDMTSLLDMGFALDGLEMDRSRVFEIHSIAPSLIRLTGQLATGDMYTVEITIHLGGDVTAEIRNARGVNVLAAAVTNENMTAMLRATLSIPSTIARMYRMTEETPLDTFAPPPPVDQAPHAAGSAAVHKRKRDDDM